MSIFGKIMGEIFGHKDHCEVDVAEILDRAAADKNEDLDWRKSIVDLMRVLDIDSSLRSRKEMAKELGYTVTKDTAGMNAWLHKEVMKRFADNGGKNCC